MLSFRNVSIINDQVVIDDLSFELNKGELISFETSPIYSHAIINTIIKRINSIKGDISILDKPHQQINRSDYLSIGIVEESEGLYERQTVKQYLNFFHELYKSKHNLAAHLLVYGLGDISNIKLKNLNMSQRKRLIFCRECLKPLKLLICVYPFRNIDYQEIRIMYDIFESLKSENVSILAFSNAYKEALYLSNNIMLLDHNGLKIIEHNDVLEKSDEVTNIKIEKVPVKNGDKTLLINPSEIDYVESDEGTSFIYVRGSKFSSNMTLNDLEKRLRTYGFFRCHRSYIVNLQRINEIITWTKDSFSLVLDDKIKSTVPLSKNRISELKRIINI